jgi:hypothetical protein
MYDVNMKPRFKFEEMHENCPKFDTLKAPENSSKLEMQLSQHKIMVSTIEEEVTN